MGLAMVLGTPVSSRELDDTDRLLLEALQEDARASHRELSRKTGIALATVNRRVKAMEEEGVILGYDVRVDPKVLGYDIAVVVGLRIEKGYLRPVQEAISKDPRVHSVLDVTGEWDGLVLARCRNRADLDDLAKTTLSAEHIQRTNTMIVLHEVLDHRTLAIPSNG